MLFQNLSTEREETLSKNIAQDKIPTDNPPIDCRVTAQNSNPLIVPTRTISKKTTVTLLNTVQPPYQH